jgi:diaminohydroxyphosphoribosylaminopyrimidine deaminase/5-amino-6-(5-phosphoribosylamino)uracil reductase
MNRFFFRYVTGQLPYVVVKIAQTLDGFIALDRTSQTWITNPAVRRRVHRWRSEYDAVLVGIGTVKSDNPELTVRDIAGRNPIRVLIDRDLEVSPTARILRNAAEDRVVIFTAGEPAGGNARAIKNTGAEVIPVESEKNGRLAMRSVLQQLHGRGVASVMVEGGQKIFTQIMSQGLADELQVFIAPVIWGSGIRAVAEKTDLENFSLISSENLSDNLLVTFRRNG